jgi:hypothetical protein
MRQIINRKVYDTETSERLGSNSGGYCTDFRYWEEELYRSPKGTYFVAGSGGPLSRYAENVGNGSTGGSGIRILTEIEAAAWAEENDQQALSEYFGHMLEEG